MQENPVSAIFFLYNKNKWNISYDFYKHFVYFNEAGTDNVHLKPKSQAKKYK